MNKASVPSENLLEELERRAIRRVKVGGFDVDGVLRGKYMSIDKIRSALAAGFGFCDVIFGWDIADTLYERSSVTGADTGFPDALAIIDAATLRLLPWEPHVALLIVDFHAPSGQDHPACPRSLLKRVIARAQGLGYQLQASCEYEFFFFKETSESLEAKGYRGLTPLSPGMFGYSMMRTGQNRALMADIMDQMAAFDIEIEGLHTETGPGVYEAALRYDELLAAADKAALFKVALKQIAHEHGLSVTFMAKCNASLPGCSGHMHQSMWRGNANAFYAGGEPSEVMRHYLGGQCALMSELTAMVSPTINSYKRYVPGLWAPLTASWGVENRTTALRVIGLDSESSCRVEVRQSAADINPYLALAASVGAGLYGVERAIEPPAPIQGDGSDQGSPLPRTLEQATALFERSQAAAELFGDDFVKHYALTRRWEVQEYQRAVSDWELKRYFEAI